MVERITDDVLIDRFLKGDESAFNLMAARYQERIYWHARRMLGNHFDADEIVQEVLLVLYKKLKTFKADSSLYTWIYRITQTRTLNLIKKQKVKRFLSIDDEDRLDLRDNTDVVADIENREKLKTLDTVLQQLPVKQREVFALRHFEEMSYEEIAELTGKSVGGLKANYYHALQKVTKLMEQYDG